MESDRVLGSSFGQLLSLREVLGVSGSAEKTKGNNIYSKLF